MPRRLLFAFIALSLAISACAGDTDEGTTPEETQITEEADQPTVTTSGEEQPETITTTTTTAEKAGAAEGDRGATLTIGDESWTFDAVAFCANPPTEPQDESFVLVATQDDLQLIVRVNDDSGEQRLEGEGVYDTIDFTNTVDPTQGAWMASSQTTGEQFVQVEGDTVAASASFDDLRTTEFDELPGMLSATCP